MLYNVPVKTYVVVKTHELALKGKNRPWFMRRLAENLRAATRGAGVSRVWQGQMMVGLTLEDEDAWPLVERRVRDCFGVAKFYKCYSLPLDLDRVKETLASCLEGIRFDSFRISANRADKRFPVKSGEINRDVGQYVKDLTGARVDLTHPGLQIFLEVLPTEILLYFDETRGYGGLPVGVSGLVTVMLSGGIDSPVAAWQMMKRGCRAHFVHFHSYPLVDRSSIEKAGELAQLLTRHQYKSQLSLAPMGEAQKRIILSTPQSYRVILYRRFMMRVAEALARSRKAKAIITGESCGQVSSQTLDNLAAIDAVATMPVLRPLIGFNKDEIVAVARELETFPISVLPDQDCCSLFVPRHPETRARLETAARLESALPMEELVRETLENVETREFAYAPAELPGH